MHPKNLLYTDKSLFDPPPDPSKGPPNQFRFDDVNSGVVYRKAYKELCMDPTLEIPLGIIFFVDSTHTDFHGRLCLEPLTFTLSIFNRAARFSDDFWGILGWLSKIPYGASIKAQEKNDDYHHMLEILLSKIYELQNNELKGFKWKIIDVDGHEHDCVFKAFPLCPGQQRRS